ncbi:hypothetical protein C7E17_22405, partial [Stenotrophomonas maltophilia]
ARAQDQRLPASGRHYRARLMEGPSPSINTVATWAYLRRPPQLDPPRHPTGNPLLLLLWPLRVQGAALPN